MIDVFNFLSVYSSFYNDDNADDDSNIQAEVPNISGTVTKFR